MTATNIDQTLAQALQLHQSGRFAEAEAMYRRILVQQPNHADVLHLLGLVAHQTAHSDLGLELIRKAISVNPSVARYYHNLGVILSARGRLEEAVPEYTRALEIRPDSFDSHNNLGTALVNLGRLEEAITAYRRAVVLKPDHAESFNGLSVALGRMGRSDEALDACKKALALSPDYPAAYNNMGTALKDQGRPEEALEAYQKALALQPDYAEAQSNLGTSLMGLARLDEAIEAYRRAMELKPGEPGFYSNVIFTMSFHPGFDAKAILRECLHWDERHGKPARPFIRPHANDRDPDRRLRIGYVSSDLRGHVVGWNLLPLIREHDHAQFEVFCYSSGASDAVTEKLRPCSDHWRQVELLGDEKLAQQIRDDRIDVLIDLSLHTANNRLPVFARVPAPVQITYLGYCATSGIKGMHYRFSDPHLDPPQTDLNCYSEETLRLPETYWCYQPGGATPEVSELPAKKSGPVTFGCMNNFAKVSASALELWCEILGRVAGSRLLIHAPPGKHLQLIQERLHRHGITPDRAEFIHRQGWKHYIKTYDRIDIGLDPIPFGGGITTCDTLWMGVPVVSLSGQTAVGRGGRSILCNLGLGEWVAYSPNQYVQIAAELAGDVTRLAELRRTMRQRMKASPLMDARRFAGHVEAAYRQVWKRWCAESGK